MPRTPITDTPDTFSLIQYPEGQRPNPYDRKLPRSSVVGAKDLRYFDKDQGAYVGITDLRTGMPIQTAYHISDHGLYKGRGDNNAIEVGVSDGRNEKVILANVTIYLSADSDPLDDDVLPLEVLGNMLKDPEDNALRQAYYAFWTKALSAHQQRINDAQKQATLVQEEPAPPVNAAPEPEPNDPIVVDIDPVDKQPVQQVKREVELVAADMSAAQYTMITESGRLALDAFKEAWPARPALLGSVIGFGILEGILEVESAECELATALVQVTEGTRRIQGVTCEEVRTDRWRVSLFCREAVGRVVTPHVVHVTPGVAGPLYRVTGSRKYPHQVEVLNYVTASFDAAYHLYV